MLTKILPMNEHAVDRALRVLLGVALLSLTFVGPRSPWGLVGLVPLLTGLVGSCPLYTLIGLTTRGGKSGARAGAAPAGPSEPGSCCGGTTGTT